MGLEQVLNLMLLSPHTIIDIKNVRMQMRYIYYQSFLKKCKLITLKIQNEIFLKIEHKNF